MPSTTRAKLKEEMEGMHRNLDWIVAHSTKCLSLVDGKHVKLTDMFALLGTVAKELDDRLQDVYSTI